MFPGVDATKSQTLFHYCAHATRRLVERDYVKRQLEDQILKLRKVANKDVKGKLDELERQISATIAMEQRISKHQGEEDVFHRKLKDKMDILEKRLGVFLENREERAERIRILERKVLERLSTKTQKITLIKDDLKKLEKMHKDLAKSGKHKKQLGMVNDKISDLKSRLRTLETT
ncbi:hypothetical protein HY492_03090 [Candidatus Woesearchaeota archaeon]|nr:hypothetical protein [Candidatus Woesearchaeota archaeon]